MLLEQWKDWTGCRTTTPARKVVKNGRAHTGFQERAPRAAVLSVALAALAAMFISAFSGGALAQNCVGTTGPCFQGLGFLTLTPPNSIAPDSQGSGISPDGSIVVGFSIDTLGNSQAFRWSNGTMTGLSYFNASQCSSTIPCYSYAYGVNALGVIAGYASYTYSLPNNLSTTDQAFTYSGSGLQGLGFLCTTQLEGPYGTEATAIASQATVVVGSAGDTGCNGPSSEAAAFANAGINPLGLLSSGTSGFSLANAVNATGQVIVGQSTNNTSGLQAFVWQNGLTGLPYLHGTDNSSSANAVSALGAIIAGASGGSSSVEAVRWVNGAVADLGWPGVAAGISANGNVVVGSGSGTCGGAVRWTPVDACQIIYNLLAEAGVTGFGAWSLQNATAVSATGTTITGYGLDPNGHTQAWIARLPAPGGPNAVHDFNATATATFCFATPAPHPARWRCG